MKFIDFFAGIGGFHSGMELAGHECVGWVEWDKYARQSYKAIYNMKGIYTAHDITKIKNGNELPQSDVWCFGSPCTNISLAGNREGLHGESSSMFFEVMRLLHDRKEIHRPAYLFMENVKNLLSSNGGRDFAEVLIQMDKNGYDVEWQVLNSKEVVPQNRERVFIIGHRRGVSTNKVFPVDLKKYRTENRILADVLQKEADNKYYLGKQKQELFIKKVTPEKINKQEKSNEIIQVANIVETKSFGGNPQRERVYSTKGICPTLNTMQGGGLEPKIAIINGTKRGYSFAKENDGIDFGYPKSKTRRGRVQPQRSNTLTASGELGCVVQSNGDLTLRKLTPLECWRLQGFTDEQFHKAKETGTSDSQLYKQAGNAVTVPVIQAIANELN